MKRFSRYAFVTVFLLAACLGSLAQEKMSLSATAFGTSTQMGRMFNVNIDINSYSTPEDQRTLLEAFNKGGNNAMVDALSKMPARGRISTPGTLGYDVKYIRVWQTPTGRKFRLVTDRRMTFGEVWRDSRSTDYSLSAAEIELSNEKGKSTGTLLPACQVKLNKQNELEIETYQNPWRLDNFINWDK